MQSSKAARVTRLSQAIKELRQNPTKMRVGEKIKNRKLGGP